MNKLIFIMSISLFFSCEKPIENKSLDKVSSLQDFNDLAKVEPPNWWVGFKNTRLQVLIYDNDITNAIPSISYAGVSIIKVHTAENPNYLFIDLSVDKSAKAGKFNILFSFKDGSEKTHTYELKNRKKKAKDYIGFNASDVIYLITPDRFANGNSKNDSFKSLQEKTIDRTKDYARHGGDIAGIKNHLDYIADMGFTAIWPSPLVTNDMSQWSYHGYAMTDFYQVDPRFGSLQEYKDLANKSAEKGIKLIMDQVANHCGFNHWWMQDLPFKDWLSYQSYFESNKTNWSWKVNKGSNHARTTNQDIYASKKDKEELTQGWFTDQMPDLNQKNPFMANYLIQNSIWWIETLGLGGIRQDTYPYPDKNFMAHWSNSIMNEYPNFSIVGEEWSYNPLLVGYWQKGALNKDGYKSNLSATMDFPMEKNIIEGLNESENWDSGLIKIYEGLANDFHYANPSNLMTFLDNHDMDRVFTKLQHDFVNTKIGISYMLMLPRTPQIYYGTEIAMENSAKLGDHGLIRTDFPGGWPDDKINGFLGEGLSKEQKELQRFIKKVLNFRKKAKAIHKGKTIHFKPFKGTYFLFRVLGDEIVVHIINKNKKPITIDLHRYAEIGLQGKTLRNIITDEEFIWNERISLSKKGSIILTTKLY